MTLSNRAALTHLSRRQLQILKLRAEGYNNKQIAEKLDISHYTVKEHISIVLKKIQARTVTQAIAYVIRNNMI